MKKVLFIDRDGTIIAEPEDEQVDSFEKMVFLLVIPCLIKCNKILKIGERSGIESQRLPEGE